MPRKAKEMPIRGDRLRDIREQRGLTQTELALLCGLGSKQIWRYENNKGDPMGDSLARIARELRVSADFLLGLSDNPTGQLGDSKLTADEHRLLAAFAAGDLSAVLDLFAEELRKHRKSKGDVSGVKPDIDKPPIGDDK